MTDDTISPLRRRMIEDMTVRGSPPDADADEPPMPSFPCPCCGGRMIIIEIFERGSTPSTRPSGPIRIDTS